MPLFISWMYTHMETVKSGPNSKSPPFVVFEHAHVSEPYSTPIGETSGAPVSDQSSL